MLPSRTENLRNGCGETMADYGERKKTFNQVLQGPRLCTGVPERPPCLSFTAATVVRIPLGTPILSVAYEDSWQTGIPVVSRREDVARHGARQNAAVKDSSAARPSE